MWTLVPSLTVMNLSLGGRRGYSLGKMRWHLKKPPSYSVSDGPMMSTSHLKMSPSSIRPAEKPSTGFLLNSANCFLSRSAACVFSCAILASSATDVIQVNVGSPKPTPPPVQPGELFLG